MSRIVPVGVIGCGAMGRIHAEALSREKSCRLVGFQNRSREKAKDLAGKFGGRVYESVDTMLDDPAIRAVIIASSQQVHASQVVDALRAGKDVFCEKPLALTSAEMDMVEREVRRSKGIVMVGHQLRFHPVLLKVLQTMPKIGPAYHLDLEMAFLISGAAGRCWEDYRSGGFFMELGCHLADLARVLMGEVRDVTGRTLRLNPDRVTEDHAHCLLQFENQALGTITVSANQRIKRQGLLRGRIFGKNGRMDFCINPYRRAFNEVVLTLDSGRETFVPDGPGRRLPLTLPRSLSRVFPGFFDVYQKQMHAFLESVRTRKDPPVSLADGRAAVEIVLATYASQGKATDGPNFLNRKWSPRAHGGCHPALQSRTQA